MKSRVSWLFLFISNGVFNCVVKILLEACLGICRKAIMESITLCHMVKLLINVDKLLRLCFVQ